MNLDCDFCHQIYKVPESRYLKSKTGLRFCSRECKSQAQQLGQSLTAPLSPRATGASYRAHALRIYGARCKICKYAEHKKMLDVDHIDSNRKNNAIENLQVLCVWCHAMKTRKINWHPWKPTKDS